MIVLPWKLGTEIRDSIDKYRKENNLKEPDEVKNLGVHKRRDTFLESELELVTEISIDKLSMQYIDLFPNVKSLTIDTSDSFTQEELDMIIKSYPDIESLKIKGQENLHHLDLRSMDSLKKLDLISNRGLNNIFGIDKIGDLDELTFYDNTNFAGTNREELCRLSDEISKSNGKVNMDVLYLSLLQKIGNNNLNNYEWCESVGTGILGDELKYSTPELMNALNKARQVVNTYIKPEDDSKLKYAILYQWMCENIKYDYNALENGHVHMEGDKATGKVGGTNGTVNGLVYGSCVCEGYSKSMQMLLSLCNIPSFDISCIAEDNQNKNAFISIDKKSNMHSGNHSIIKVNLDGEIYYSDITIDAARFQRQDDRKYFLLSPNDMSKDHELKDKGAFYATKISVSTEDTKKLFDLAQERIRNVDKKVAHDKVINNVEKLLNINISPFMTYILDNNSYGQKYKTLSELMIEQKQINQKIDYLFSNHQINQETWQSMKRELNDEYLSMIEASKKIYSTTNIESDEYELAQEKIPYGKNDKKTAYKSILGEKVKEEDELYMNKQKLHEMKQQLLDLEQQKKQYEKIANQEEQEEDFGMSM